MEGTTRAKWPDFPFCSPRCKLIDLGRWLDEGYTLPADAEGSPADDGADEEKGIP